jgi:DNA-binding response OmpR family regulator
LHQSFLRRAAFHWRDRAKSARQGAFNFKAMPSLQGNNTRRPRILHAEDQAMVAEAVQLILSQAGYEVEVAADGAEALRRLSAPDAHFDLLITDVTMPVLDGWGLIARLPETGFNGPVIVLSARPGEGAEDMENPRIVGVLPKPFQIQKLVAAVSAALAPQSPSAARDNASTA